MTQKIYGRDKLNIVMFNLRCIRRVSPVFTLTTDSLQKSDCRFSGDERGNALGSTLLYGIYLQKNQGHHWNCYGENLSPGVIAAWETSVMSGPQGSQSCTCTKSARVNAHNTKCIGCGYAGCTKHLACVTHNLAENRSSYIGGKNGLAPNCADAVIARNLACNHDEMILKHFRGGLSGYCPKLSYLYVSAWVYYCYLPISRSQGTHQAMQFVPHVSYSCKEGSVALTE